MRGPSLVARHLFGRGLWLWVLVRLALMSAVALSGAIAGGEMPDLLRPMPASAVVTVALGFVEARRLSESVFLANLSVSRLQQSGWLALAAMLGEAALLTLGGFR